MFDADQSAVVFPARWLARRLAGANAQLRGLLEAQVDALEAKGNGDVVDQLRRVLRTVLVSGSDTFIDSAASRALRRSFWCRRTRKPGLKLRL